MANADRPLSPHLQVYRWQLTSVLSIVHRATGIALGVGALMLLCWLLAVATGPAAFAHVDGFLGSWIGLILLFGWSFSLFYHLCNGIRHLAWDSGSGLELGPVYATGWTVVAATAVLTIIAWAVAIAGWSH